MSTDGPAGRSHEALRARFAELGAVEPSAFEVAAAIACVITPGRDVAALGDQFDRLVAPLAEGCRDADALLGRFRQAGFRGPTQGQVTALHSDVGWVMQERQGIPITLAVLVMEAAERCQLTCQGINFPGHFLLDIDGRLADPLALTWLEEPVLQRARPQDLTPASSQAMGLRMLNNLKALAAVSSDWARLLDLLDYQLALAGTAPDLSASLHFERGDTWERMGVAALARQAYQACAELSRDADLRHRARDKMEQLGSGGETLH